MFLLVQKIFGLTKKNFSAQKMFRLFPDYPDYSDNTYSNQDADIGDVKYEKTDEDKNRGYAAMGGDDEDEVEDRKPPANAQDDSKNGQGNRMGYDDEDDDGNY